MNNKLKKIGKNYSSNQDEDHLEEQENNETQKFIAAKKVTEEASVDVRTVDEVVEADVIPDKHYEESSINLEKSSQDFGTMDEAAEYAAVTDKHNKEAIGSLQENTKQAYNDNVEMEIPVESEVIYE